MFRLLLSIVLGSGTFFYTYNKINATISEQLLRDHAIYGFAAVLICTNIALAVMKYRLCGSKFNTKGLHGLLQVASAGCLLYAICNIYLMYEKYNKTHAWNFTAENAFANIFAKAHGLAGIFIATIVSIVAIAIPFVLKSEKAVQKEGGVHAAAGKFLFTLMSCVSVFGSYLAFGTIDPVIAGGVFANYIVALIPGGAKVKSTSTPSDKKEN